MTITLLDGIFLVFTLLSAVLAMVRGFSREVLSVASWVIAAAAAYSFYPALFPMRAVLASSSIAISPRRRSSSSSC